jgi:hypothetical protein
MVTDADSVFTLGPRFPLASEMALAGTPTFKVPAPQRVVVIL